MRLVLLEHRLQLVAPDPAMFQALLRRQSLLRVDDKAFLHKKCVNKQKFHYHGGPKQTNIAVRQRKASKHPKFG